MREVQLTKGYVALVSDADYEFVSQWKWHALIGTHHVYACRTYRSKGRKSMVYMHRALLNAPQDMDVDHINRNSLDNQRDNLRLATRAQNVRNQGPSKSSTSGYKGIRWHQRHQRWYASIKSNRKSHYLGHYGTAEEAARAYDKAAKEMHGEFAYQNFK